MPSKKTTALGLSLAVLAIMCFGLFYFGNRPAPAARPFSDYQVLENLWNDYKKTYVADPGKTTDPSSGEGSDITTSEGQSYTMLRAVWMGDEPAFDQAFSWSKQHLQRPDSHLFSWLYGKKPDGSLGILTAKGGQNTASDADTDTALALVLAYSRWNDASYLNYAKSMINDIWNQEVATVTGVPYMTADNLERQSANPIINPSYLSPAAYRIFAQVDRTPGHDWAGLVTSSYRILNESITDPLDKTASADLPPDWVALNAATGRVLAVGHQGLDSNYGFDAMRIPWRLELDQQWFGDNRDNEVLYKMSFLSSQWQKNHALASVYAHDGAAVQPAESPAMYGGSIGYFMAEDSQDASAVFSEKLQSLYNPAADAFSKPLSYYDANWVWFGMALYDNALPNLAKASVF